MPTYNYYCSKCDSHFSYFQKMSESSLATCEECGGKIERIITGGTGLIFKGSGFYLTDYKDGKKSTSTDSPSTSGDNGDGKKTKPEKKDNTKTKESVSTEKSAKPKEKKSDE